MNWPSEFTVGLIMLVIGVIMLMVEAATPGTFIAVPATVLIVLGIIAMAVPGFLYSIWSPIIAVVVGIPMTLVTMRFYAHFSPPSPPTTTVGESLISRQGIVTVEIRPHSISGKVRIGNDIWSATSDETIHAGERVLVTGSEGVHVIVKHLNPKGPERQGTPK